MDTEELKVVNKKDITFNEALYLINEHKQFELSNNKDFYNTLLKQSEAYFMNITNDFIEKEFKMSGAFNEIGIINSKTPKERFLIWESKINNYFSSLSYLRFIKSKTDNHSKNINNQRRAELEELLNFISEDSLFLKKQTVSIFNASEESVNLSISKANESIKENLKDVAYTSAEVASVVATGGTAIVIGSVEATGITEMAYDFVVPTEDETKKILIKEYSNFLEHNNIDFTIDLNQNTTQYYDRLIKLINDRKNDKIRL
jgi:ketosteroid isomerase-like protein